MSHECIGCGKPTVVFFINKHIEQQTPMPGNPYRGFCTACNKLNPLADKDDFLLDLHNPDRDVYVLPPEIGAPDTRKSIESIDDFIPLSEYTGNLKILEEIQQQPANQDDANRFICPADGCDSENTGVPDSCPTCGAEYTWPDEENETEEVIA